MKVLDRIIMEWLIATVMVTAFLLFCLLFFEDTESTNPCKEKGHIKWFQLLDANDEYDEVRTSKRTVTVDSVKYVVRDWYNYYHCRRCRENYKVVFKTDTLYKVKL